MPGPICWSCSQRCRGATNLSLSKPLFFIPYIDVPKSQRQPKMLKYNYGKANLFLDYLINNIFQLHIQILWVFVNPLVTINCVNWEFGNPEGIVVTAHAAVRHGLDDLCNVHHHHQRHCGIHVRILLRIKESVSIDCLMAFIQEILRHLLACNDFFLSIFFICDFQVAEW